MGYDANSQNKIEVQTTEKEMTQGPQTAFTMLIPKSKAKEVEMLWNKYVNNRPANERFKNLTTGVGNIFKSKDKKTKRDPLKMEKKGDELHVKSIELDKISLYPMDIYAVINQLPEGCQLSAFFQYTDSVFINPSNTPEDRLNLISDFVRDFGREAYKNVVDEHIKLANRDVSREESNLKELHAGIQRAEKSITRDETLIQQYNTKISELRNDSASMIEAIASKKKEFSEMSKDSADFENTKAELKSQEKEKARIPREIRLLEGKIKSKELDIESARNQIAENELEIKNQQAVVQEKQQIAEELIREKGEIQ
ncbi:MAG TPA: hypothetical protein DCL77_21540 [Prolixibacteraceae bacterium]|nr:hypothetical protein [Prolixibacteraceae bacterium]